MNKTIKGEYYIVNEVNNYWILINNLDYFNTINDSYYVWDYFYNPQEIRKLKLKQLK